MLSKKILSLVNYKTIIIACINIFALDFELLDVSDYDLILT